MIRSIFILALALTVFSLYGQGKCFEDCMENLENPTLPSMERNSQILQELVGCAAPDFRAKTLGGEILSLSELKGKTIVLNFWFIGCPPCVAEIPTLNRLVEKYKNNDDVVFIAFAKDNKNSLERFVRDHPFSYHIIPSTEDFALKYCIIAGWPTSMVIDRNGIVTKILVGGFIDDRAKTHVYDSLKPFIDAAISKK